MTDYRPEYTAEQVEAAKDELTDIAGWNGYLPLSNSIRTVLSALSTAESEVKRLGRVFSDNLDLQMEVESLRSRLESAEADSKRLDRVEQERLSVEFWIIDADGTLECNVRDPDDEFVATGKTLRDAIDAAQSPSNQGKTNG